jgi:hypothetical protein
MYIILDKPLSMFPMSILFSAVGHLGEYLMVADGRRVVEGEMHFMLESSLYSEDMELLSEKARIESELADKGSSTRRVMNPESF